MNKPKLHRTMLILSAAVIAGAAIAAGCGGDDSTTVATARPAGTSGSGGNSSTGSSSSTLGTKFTGSIPSGAPVMDQKELAFKPDKLSVKVGDTVYFLNSEAALHTVNVDGKNLLGQGSNMKKGDAVTWKPARAGTYTITCDYHPAMKATVTVE